MRGLLVIFALYLRIFAQIFSDLSSHKSVNYSTADFDTLFEIAREREESTENISHVHNTGVRHHQPAAAAVSYDVSNSNKSGSAGAVGGTHLTSQVQRSVWWPNELHLAKYSLP